MISVFQENHHKIKSNVYLDTDLEMEAFSKDSKEHKIMQERKKEKSYSLESIIKEFYL